MTKPKARFIILLAILVTIAMNLNGQPTMPEVFNENNLREQMKYIEERTRIYENYRAIREDMFQKLKRNISDSLSKSEDKIAGLLNHTLTLNHSIDSLSNALESTKINLEEIRRTKNSISILGLEVNKVIYSTIMWAIVAGLVTLLVSGFLVIKRNHFVTKNTKKELRELTNEFETYRKTSREAREKMSLEHFNEIKKLKGRLNP